MATVHKGVIPMYHLTEETMNTSNGPTSRLGLMQAKFQQKQLEEKERKLLALYEDQAHQAYQRVGQGGGKVRQLFQERRTHHHTGLDRSYPLEPIYDNKRESRGTSLDRSQNTGWKNQPTRRSKSQVRKLPEQFEEDYNRIPVNNNYEDNHVLNSSFKNQPVLFGDENDYLTKAANDLDSSRVFKKLPNIGATTLAQAYENQSKKESTVNKITDYQNNMSPAKEPELKKPAVQSKVNNVASLTKSISKMTTKTTPPKKTETKPTANATSTTRVKSISSTPLSNSKRTTPSPTASIGSSRPASNTTVKESPSSNTTPKTMKPAAKAPRVQSTRPASGASTGLASCKICSRNFAPDRVKAHEEICAKTAKKKRKVFDPVKQRLKGTEAEPYLRKGKAPPPPPLSKSNWRKKHEDFISNIRAAKVAQAHVAKGGKLSDLPPPPPMDTSDLIPCPHCGRKFNDSAAARHIPKCATMLHNKPKPGASAKAGPIKRR